MASDDRLVAQVRAGSPTAFEAIYDRHHPAILGFCRHLLGSPQDGEDAAQQAFISAYGALRRDDREIVLRPWLFTIARNRCYTTMRARHERPLAGEDVAGETRSVAPGPAETAVRREELDQTLQDVARLPEAQREALVLFELGDLSHADIAEVLEREPAQVKSLVFQARSTLIDQREARDIDCATIRQELASARGSALLRGHLRRHTRDCDGCRHFARAVRRQRTKLAAALPVASTSAFPIAALGGAAGAGSAATAASGGLGLAGGLGGFAGLGGGASLGGKAVAGVALALAGGTAGVVAEREVSSATRAAKPAVAAAATPPAPSSSSSSAASSAPRIVAVSALTAPAAASSTVLSHRGVHHVRPAGVMYASARSGRDNGRDGTGRRHDGADRDGSNARSGSPDPGRRSGRHGGWTTSDRSRDQGSSAHRGGRRDQRSEHHERRRQRQDDAPSNGGRPARHGGSSRRSGGDANDRAGQQTHRTSGQRSGAPRRAGEGPQTSSPSYRQPGSGSAAQRPARPAAVRAPARAGSRAGHGSGRGTGPHRHRSGSGGRS